jgi:hypothetical protein
MLRTRNRFTALSCIHARYRKSFETGSAQLFVEKELPSSRSTVLNSIQKILNITKNQNLTFQKKLRNVLTSLTVLGHDPEKENGDISFGGKNGECNDYSYGC